ncbi:GDSL-type esterase/lipase family protein [Pseudobacteroides cellulosolvens]|uniref:Copper amine oxidase-like domain-containing protein n=1 Tax=Pseudobacteroides cellulosolvens ATCC 35603 = DSM 2933 TaxID=398512 RepID=A0A0L6JS77_9FIRM|nr:GDSL-type esterase/lipase family protein [Pseudobacteroides cellulosolvens]KNY28658.1 copper amine oxidase-like domain-containing protein [Pseudobacteroides cellulosolvens ATCC 35603 = DSM 2933]
MTRWKRSRFVLSVLIILAISVDLFSGNFNFEPGSSYGISSKAYVLRSGKPMLLLRNICSMIDANIVWDKKNKEILCTKGIIEIKLSIGSKNIYVNGKQKSMDSEVVISNGKTLVPLSFPWKDMNIGVSWNGNKKLLSINKGPIIFFGDSITEGFKLKKYFSLSGLINKGVSGNTTADALKRVNEIITKKPDKVFIMLGTNDIWGVIDTKVTIDNYNDIITKIRTACPYADIVIQSVLPMGLSAFKRNPLASSKSIDGLNLRLKDIAKDYDLKFVDIGILLKDKNGNMDAKYTSDGVHIKSNAYSIWSEKIKKMVH